MEKPFKTIQVYVQRFLKRHKSVAEREKIKEMEKHRTELNDKGKFMKIITLRKLRMTS